MYYRFIFLGLFLLVTACGAVNVQQVSSLADQALEAKDYATFNTQAEKLKKGNSAEFEKYMVKIKDYELFRIDSYSGLTKTNEGIETLSLISKDAPLLNDYINTKITILNGNKKYFEKINSTMMNVLKNDVAKIEDSLNNANTFLILMDSLEKISATTKELKGISDDINTNIISLESQKAPDQYTSQQQNLIDSLKKYKSSIDAKLSFVDSQSSEIVSSNNLILKGNFFALATINKLSREMDKLISAVNTSNTDVKQRAESLQKAFK